MAFGKKRTNSDRLVVQNAVKSLLANIRFASVDKPVKSIVITSSVPNEGKSTLSYNLATAIATSGKTVILVECDMRKRSLSGELGVHAKNGLYAVLSGQVDLADAVVETQQPKLFFLDTEPRIPNPADILSSERFRTLFGVLEDEYDYVIVDTPPVGTFIDAAIVGAMADATILVVRNNYVHRKDVLDSAEQLKRAGANLIGSVLTRTEMDVNEYYYAYYTEDGKRVKKDDQRYGQDGQAGSRYSTGTSASSNHGSSAGKRFAR